MGLIWGGVIYIFVAIALSVFIAFMLNKVSKKELLQYLTWVIVSCAMLIIFSNKYTIGDLIGSTSSGLMFLVLGLIIVDLLVWKTKFKENRYLSKIKLPKKIILY
jgi:asparagine N-glycosylation enzyme membrane subunit Stt3